FKNKIWYGLLGSKELLQRSYRKLEERVHLECDGEPISLPNLQGIVVLNITSYAGGVNFWGSNTATAVSMEQEMGWEKSMTLLSPLRKESWQICDSRPN
uniref:Diacylglycerol kinase accessory domain-containing protein n=1 Tax=Marmota marmota marmota TaxID=9994 RepID=A0A8C5ZBC2_MARMA